MDAARQSRATPNGGSARSISWRVASGAVAGPLFVAAFTVIGAARDGYGWRRHAVSSLACGRQGWWQRANFIIAGLLWCAGARGLWQAPSRVVGPRLVPVLVAGAGSGLIGSGLFVTDPVAGYPAPATRQAGEDSADSAAPPTRAGKLHNLSAIPIFAGIPVAALVGAVAGARVRDYRWAFYSASSSLGMAGGFVLFGAAFAGNPSLAGWGGLFQRLSIASGFGWVTALTLRTLRALRAR